MSAINATSEFVRTVLEEDINGLVTMVVGAAGTGKTTMSGMQLPVYTLTKLKSEGQLGKDDFVIIINTDNSILDKRFIQLCKEFGWSYSEIRNHIKFIAVSNFNEQHNTIVNMLPKMVSGKGGLQKSKGKCRFIVVDPLNHHIRQEFAKAPADKRLNVAGRLMPQLDYQMNVLCGLARDNGIPVVVTVFPKKAFAEMVPNAWHNAYFGSLEIGHLSDIVLWLCLDKQNRGIINCGVLKHRLKPTPFYLKLKIDNYGYTVVKTNNQ